MQISAQHVEGAVIVKMMGSLDALTADAATDSINAQLSEGHVNLVADLSGVDFMSSAGLRAILSALKGARQQGGDLRLAGAQPSVQKVLRLSGFTTILQTYPTLDEAIASFTL
jgi:anti-sigma B factor antagonist